MRIFVIAMQASAKMRFVGNNEITSDHYAKLLLRVKSARAKREFGKIKISCHFIKKLQQSLCSTQICARIHRIDV